MTKKGDPNPVVMLDSFQPLVKIFSAFGRHTLHPRPQDGVFRCDLKKENLFDHFLKSVSSRERVEVFQSSLKEDLTKYEIFGLYCFN
jgi:hypothetical protein